MTASNAFAGEEPEYLDDDIGAATEPHCPAQVDPLAGLRTPDDPPWDVYLTGTVFLDIIFTGLGSAPVRGTESWARGMGSSPGGIANMATALARLGLKTSLAAAFGDDHYGEYCWDALAQGEGIDLSPSRTVRGWHSPVTVSMAYEGERTMVSHGHEPPADTLFRQQNAPGHPARPAPRSPPSRPANATRGSPRRRRGDPDLRRRRLGRHGAWDLAGLADLEHCEAFLPNAAEAMRYTRSDCPRAAAHALAEYVPLAVVTLGADGAYAVDGRTGESAEVPAIAVEALDPTGAGDVFVAGFVTGTLADWPLADRLAFAGLTAALSVQEFGGSLSAPGWSEIGAWWRKVQSVEGQDPAALRRYAFLEGLVPGEEQVRRGPCGEQYRRSGSAGRVRVRGGGGRGRGFRLRRRHGAARAHPCRPAARLPAAVRAERCRECSAPSGALGVPPAEGWGRNCAISPRRAAPDDETGTAPAYSPRTPATCSRTSSRPASDTRTTPRRTVPPAHPRRRPSHRCSPHTPPAPRPAVHPLCPPPPRRSSGLSPPAGSATFT